MPEAYNCRMGSKHKTAQAIKRVSFGFIALIFGVNMIRQMHTFPAGQVLTRVPILFIFPLRLPEVFLPEDRLGRDVLKVLRQLGL